MYEIFEHTADLGLRVRASDWPTLMQDAARGFFSILVVNLERVLPVQERKIRIVGEQPDFVLLDWLNELLYIFESEQLLLSEFDIQQQDDGFEATCRGEPVDHTRHQLDHEIKAITYHGLTATKQPDGSWFAEVIVDI